MRKILLLCPKILFTDFPLDKDRKTVVLSSLNPPKLATLTSVFGMVTILSSVISKPKPGTNLDQVETSEQLQRYSILPQCHPH